MKLRPHPKSGGVALVIVMIAIFVLSMLVAALAYSMKVETKLAMTANNEAALTWLGRSGVELARYAFAQQLSVTAEPYDSLNQKWAGGPGTLASENSPLAGLSMENFQVGDGRVTVKITDLERRININKADAALLQQALTLVGVNASDISAISDSILDWLDPNPNSNVHRPNGAKSDYYQSLDPPYEAKNAPMDDLSELLLIRGITQDIYWGSSSTNHAPAFFQKTDRFGRILDTPAYTIGLAEIFTPLSDGLININTASVNTLQAIPGIDANAAEQIVKLRSGPDGTDGTEDDIPFRNVGELVNAVNPRIVPQLARFCDVRSKTFQVQVDAELGMNRRTFYAVIGRAGPRDVQILSFYWK
jgi:general secretion pathway protein K